MDDSTLARARPRPVTMRDVAEYLQISKQTVSAVINNKPGITEATRQRVLVAIDELGYRIDQTARSLRTGRTRTIALFTTDISSPVAGKMASVAEDQAYAAGYTLVLYNTRDDMQREASYIESAIQRSVDGVLFVASRDDTTALGSLEEAGLPVVVLDRVPRSYRGPAVHLDNVAAGRLAGAHLLELGHRHIAHVTGPTTVHIAEERLRGFRDCMNEAGIHPAEFCVERARGWGIECGYDATRALLACRDDFTAVFCGGDMLAIGAGRALREAGLRIPNDVSLIGIDDIDLDEYINPPLTTVSQSIPEVAGTAMQMLLGLLDGNPPKPSRVVIPPQLVIRQSTASPREPFAKRPR